jgi:hypothetical protein
MVVVKGKHNLILLRNSPRYSESSPVKVLSVMEEEKRETIFALERKYYLLFGIFTG